MAPRVYTTGDDDDTDPNHAIRTVPAIVEGDILKHSGTFQRIVITTTTRN